MNDENQEEEIQGFPREWITCKSLEDWLYRVQVQFMIWNYVEHDIETLRVRTGPPSNLKQHHIRESIYKDLE